MSFPVESIPDDDELYRRVPPNRFNSAGRPIPGAFTEFRGGMSTDWSKYATPAQSLAGSRDPKNFGIVSLDVGAVRALSLSVAHTPRPFNQAHADVTGIGDDPEIRLALSKAATVHVTPPRRSVLRNVEGLANQALDEIKKTLDDF
jgi:hypothetical protein